MAAKHLRSRCEHCHRTCEQRQHGVWIGTQLVPAQTCIECEATYALAAAPEPVSGEVEVPALASEPLTPVAAEAAALTERLYSVWQRTAEFRGPVRQALETLIAERDGALGHCVEFQQSLTEACGVKDRLTAQLLACERKAASYRPPADPGPCRHCGEAQLTRVHFVAGGGHSFEAQQ